MTLYTLDTNAVTAILREDVPVQERLFRALAEGDEVRLNAISYFETKRGLELPRFARKHAIFERLTQARGVLELDLPALDQAALVYQHLRAAGALLEDADLLAAGIALSRDAVLVTRNARHLSRVPGLRLEDWEGEG